ncbi:MAG: toll/interleukin-1 receptor domain-containing protein [Chloroflexota bacterium]
MPDRYQFRDVMISYSREDSEFVTWLDQSLQAHGKTTWVDHQSIPAGEDWWEEIKAGIESSRTVIFVMTSASVESKACCNEITHAAKHIESTIH